MPYNGSGTYTPPAADFPAVTQTVISSTKFNNILNDVAAALTNAVTRDGQSPMTAALPMGGWPINAISLGSAGSPSINFTGNTTTGIYAAANLVGVSLGGSGVLFITPTGLGWRMSPSYELSIGGASTLVNAQIRSTGSFGVSGSSALLRFDDAGGSKGFVGFDGDGSAKLRLYNSYAAGGIIFGANNTVHMELDGQGRLAIAQGNVPTQILNLYRGGATQVVMAAGNSATGLNGSYFGVDTSGNCLIMQTQSLAMVFGTSSSERMRLDSSGNLCIGGAPTGFGKLDVRQATNFRILFSNNAAYGSNGVVGINDSGAETTLGIGGTPIIFCTQATERMRITAAGDVGIGTVGPVGRFAVAGSGGVQVVIDSDANRGWVQSYGSRPLQLNPIGNDIAMCLAGGSVGIGTTSPGYRLDVVDAAGNLFRFTRSTDQLGAFISSGTCFFGGLSNSPLAFVTNNIERMRITATGNIVAGASAALATTATDGFLYVPTCAGTPTGVPTAITGMAPIVVNTTNNKLYFYSGGAWRDAGP